MELSVAMAYYGRNPMPLIDLYKKMSKKLELTDEDEDKTTPNPDDKKPAKPRPKPICADILQTHANCDMLVKVLTSGKDGQANWDVVYDDTLENNPTQIKARMGIDLDMLVDRFDDDEELDANSKRLKKILEDGAKVSHGNPTTDRPPPCLLIGPFLPVVSAAALRPVGRAEGEQIGRERSQTRQTRRGTIQTSFSSVLRRVLRVPHRTSCHPRVDERQGHGPGHFHRRYR